MDIFTNIYRLYDFCFQHQKQNIFILFVDFKNAYNTIDWHHLFSTLDEIFAENPAYSQFIKILYSHTKLRIGKNTLIPKRGLMQGSTLSPLLFDFCVDPILRMISTKLSLEQILVFAGDLSFLCLTLDEVDTTISL